MYMHHSPKAFDEELSKAGVFPTMFCLLNRKKTQPKTCTCLLTIGQIAKGVSVVEV